MRGDRVLSPPVAFALRAPGFKKPPHASLHTAQVARPTWQPPLSISFRFSPLPLVRSYHQQRRGPQGRPAGSIPRAGRATTHPRAWIYLAAVKLRLCVAPPPPTGGFCFFSFRCEERTRRLRTARSAEVNFRHPHFVTAILRLCCGFSLFELKLNPVWPCAGLLDKKKLTISCPTVAQIDFLLVVD